MESTGMAPHPSTARNIAMQEAEPGAHVKWLEPVADAISRQSL